MSESVKNKKYVYIFFIVLFMIVVTIYFSVSFLINKKEEILENKNLKQTEQEILKKRIDSSMDTVDPNNYDSVKDFLYFMNTWSGIELNVDLENETFYISSWTWKTYTVTRFDKELISEIDSYEDDSMKNKAILDIYSAYKNRNYLLPDSSSWKSWVRLLNDWELPSNLQVHNSILLPYSWESYKETLSRLESIEDKTLEDNINLSYIYDFWWDYEKSNKLKESLEIEKINYTISWKVYNDWNFLSWAKIEVLNYKDIYTYSNENWEYSLSFESFPMTRLRYRASFDWFSDWYNDSFLIFDWNNQEIWNLDFTLHKFNSKKLIKNSDLNKWEVSIKSTIWNEFIFEKNKVIDLNWKIYRWDFYAYIFEFNRYTPWMENYLSLDNFDDLSWYNWDMMITNGMTYLMLTDLEWNELFVKKSNPIVTNQIVDLDYLLNNSQNWTTKLTESQLDLILEKSKQDWYPIDNKFLTERWITWFAPWWVLNRTKWIWENRGIKLLNKDWLKQSLYYNID